jgi:nucleoside-diphosphate-sugar epimerase
MVVGTITHVATFTRDRQVVHAEGVLGEPADHRTDRHAEHRRGHQLAQARHHLGHRVANRLVVDRWRTERRRQAGEQRAVVVERALGPLAPRGELRFGELDVGAGDVAHVHARDAGELAYAGRSTGSTLASGLPPVAPSCANWRAASQFSGPCPASARARSPNSGNPPKGSSGRLPGARDVGHGVDATRVSAASVAVMTVVAADPVATGVRRVYVRGADGNLGSRVLTRLGALDGVDVVAGGPTAAVTGSYDTIVELGVGDHDTRARRRESVTEGAAELIADALTASATHIVMVSSAMAYGALANNPVPITEGAVLRPDPEFVYARQLASAEELVEDWRRAAPGRTVTVLRPVVAMAADGTSSLARALAAGLGRRYGEEDPGAQFVHLDDVASAIVLAVRRRLDGVYNVAPDGWIPGERVRALLGERLRLPLPERLAEVVGRLQWRFQRGPIPPGLQQYTREPWLVANDKLRAEGWRPTVTNEQAFVEGTEAKWWTMITPKRRQELALGGAVLAVGLMTLVGVSLGRAWWRRRARRLATGPARRPG